MSFNFLNQRQALFSVLALIAIVFICAAIYFDRWRLNMLQPSDALGYYVYLPAYFIHNDLNNLKQTHHAGLSRIDGYQAHPNLHTNEPIDYGNTTYINGNQVIQYTMGVAMLNLPFFAVGHAIAHLGGFTADGFSAPYLLAMYLANIFYILLGLWALFWVLKPLVGHNIALWSILSIAFVTNLFYFATYNAAMAHGYLFTLWAWLLYATPRLYQSFSYKYAVLVGVCVGFIALIRPTEAVAIFVPVLYGVTNWQSLKNRFIWALQNWSLVVLAIFVAFIVWTPQLCLWKAYTGKWLFYSYGQQGFNFLKPQILNGLFAFGNGWLVYTPIFLIAAWGAWYMYRQKNGFLGPLLVIFPITVYANYSWWCWQYINGFGSRPMIDIYALLAIPLALTLQKGIKLPFWRWPLLAFWVLCLWLNLFTTYQFYLDLQFTEASNPAFFWASLGKTKLSNNDLIAFDTGRFQPDSTQLKFVKNIATVDFETPDVPPAITDTVKAISGEKFAVLSPQTPFSKGIADTLKNLLDINSIAGNDNKQTYYVKINCQVYLPQKEHSIYKMSMVVFELLRNQKNIVWQGIRLQNKISNTRQVFYNPGKTGLWQNVQFYVKLPVLQPTDELKLYGWNIGGGLVFIDDLRLSLWQKQ